MFFMNGARTEIINTDFVERFLLVEKEDACLVIASYARGDETPVTLGRYTTKAEARDALYELLDAISNDSYEMPENTGTYKPMSDRINRYHGKKTKGHGGS